MRILRPIVAPSPALVAIRDPEFTSRGAMRPRVVGDDLVRRGAVLRCVGPWSTFARIGGDLRSKVVDPAAHGLIGHDDSALSQQIFHVAEAEREPKI